MKNLSAAENAMSEPTAMAAPLGESPPKDVDYSWLRRAMAAAGYDTQDWLPGAGAAVPFVAHHEQRHRVVVTLVEALGGVSLQRMVDVQVEDTEQLLAWLNDANSFSWRLTFCAEPAVGKLSISSFILLNDLEEDLLRWFLSSTEAEIESTTSNVPPRGLRFHAG